MMYTSKTDFSDGCQWDQSKSGADNRDKRQLWVDGNERAFMAGKLACEDGQAIDENLRTDSNIATTRHSKWWEHGWKSADLARTTQQQLDDQRAALIHKLGFDPENLVAGNVIVMWDGKDFGVYANLSAAIQDAKTRLTEQNHHILPDAYECLEFLEVRPCRNEPGIRISFDYPVKELGNQISSF